MSTASASSPASAPASTRGRGIVAALAAAIALITVFAYWRVGEAGFVNLDDDAYVEHQPLVNQGLRSAGIAWAFTGVHSSNWHPLTTLSHMLDCELFGVKPAPMHWENLLWHVLNSVLVFLVWRALTGALWRSALVAGLFALHPLHVESVAWISERKDVLCAFFWLLGLWAYAGYARRASVGRYLLVAAAMILALLSKPMAVTFPCTLLLLDFWPLARWPQRSWGKLFLEKLPLFALVAVHSVLTFLVQSGSGAANFGERFPLGARLGNAVVSYARYLGKTVWPDSFSPLYFHPGYWPALAVGSAAVLLLAVTVVAWRLRRTQPWLTFGWLWFLGTLVPVIGLVQVGAQSMADRYMYLPILGLFTALVWGSAALAEKLPRGRNVFAATAVASLVALTLLTLRQAPAWKDSITLYDRSIAAGEDNAAVRYLRAMAFAVAGRPAPEVATEFYHALRHRPDYINALTQLAVIALANQKFDESRQLIEASLRAEPNNPNLHQNLGAFYVRLGRPAEAIPHLEHALHLNPRLADAHHELGQIRFNENRPEEGRAHFEIRARAEPWNADALADYGVVLTNLRRPAEALPFLERALWIRPNDPRARQTLAVAQLLLRQKN